MGVPVRTCVVTKQRHNKIDMVRIVYFNDYVEVDAHFKKRGRGVYMVPELKVFDEGILKHRIENSFKLGRNLDKVEILRLRQEFEQAVEVREKESALISEQKEVVEGEEN